MLLKKLTVQNSVILVLFAIIFVLIYLLNSNYPTYADDFPFSMALGDDVRMVNFFQIIEKQVWFFFNHSGRIVEHIIAHTLLLFGNPWADILQSCAFVFLIFVMYKIVNVNNKSNPSLVVFILLLMWFFQPTLAVTVLNITSGAVYMWGTLINILFIYPFYKYYASENYKSPLLNKYLFLFLGIIAGWTQENMAPSMILIILVFSFLKYRESKNIKAWCIWGIIGSIIGCALLIIAPGNYVRYESDANNLENKPFFLINGIYNIVGGYLDHAILITLIFVLFLVLYWLLPKKEINSKVIISSIIFWFISLVATILMVASPIFPTRAWFGIFVFMTISISILYANIEFKNIYLVAAKYILIILFCGLFVKQYIVAYNDLKQINTAFTNREEAIEEQKSKGLKDVIITEKIIPQTSFFDISDVIDDTTHWLYPVMVNYYGVNSITLVKKNERIGNEK